MTTEKQSGYVAIIGRPNVGKSTLLNYILGKKLSITSRKPQTTRHRILGVKTIEEVQVVYLDTPGIHYQAKRALNRYMNQAALSVLHDVDMILFVVEALNWTEEDSHVVKLLQKINVPTLLVINKIDRVKDRNLLLPFIEKHAQHLDFKDIIPVSAKQGLQITELEQSIITALPKGQHYFPPEQFTDRSQRFIVAETVREQLMRQLGQELPYATTVTIDAFEENKNIIKIAAMVWVEREGQKGIVIGKEGSRLKAIGQSARYNLEAYFEKKVLLKLWCKVKQNWSDNQSVLDSLGYNDE
ncbi:MAG: GTPase Era [Gammaproteobacteria bacterium]|nr:GTPase Era [Gammaproteobacteria bacterium]